MSTVLGQNSRAFNRIFALAQQKLQDAFGMELVELPSRAGLDDSGFDGTQETQPTTGLKKKGAFYLFYATTAWLNR